MRKGWTSGAVLTLFVAFGLPAFGVPLTVGSSVAVGGTADPFGALIPTATTGPVAFTSSISDFAGMVTQDVFLGTTIGGVTGTSFRWIVSTDSSTTNDINRLTITDFAGWMLDADFITGSGTATPFQATRGPLGAVVGFNYLAGAGAGIGPGAESSVTLYVQTNAPTFRPGFTSFINGGGRHGRNLCACSDPRARNVDLARLRASWFGLLATEARHPRKWRRLILSF